SVCFLVLSPTPAPPALSPLSLHDALPISSRALAPCWKVPTRPPASSWCPFWVRSTSFKGRSTELWLSIVKTPPPSRACGYSASRSEEHTSELQSRFDLVCRLLLEKKKTR